MNMYPRKPVAIALAAVLTVLAGCPAQNPPPGDDNLADLTSLIDMSKPAAAGEALDFRDAFMQTFEVEQHGGIAVRGVRTLLPVPDTPAARATWPADTQPRPFSQAAGSISNYPETGLLTSYVLAAAPAVGANAYLVTVTTQYPASNIMNTYVESYHVKDVSPSGSAPDGVWSAADPIVDQSGVVDSTARVLQQINFRDGSIRTEKIVKLILPSSSEDGFAPFNVTGTLTFPAFAYPDADPNAVFSSVVVYHQSFPTTHDFSFWQGVVQEEIVGVRYYTEHYVSGGAQYKGTTAAYEKAVSAYDTQGGTYAGTLQTIFVGSLNSVLAESVFRKEVLFNVTASGVDPHAVGQNSIMRSHVVDITSQADYQLQVLNEDVTRLYDWEGETFAIPTGGAAEVLATNPGAEVLTQTEATNPDGSAVPLVTADPGTGDLATLYTSIENGAATQNIVGTDLTDTLDAQGVLLAFDGHVGARYDDTFNPTTSGTVQAWVYIAAQTNWGGIVHKGEKLDFSDEAWSLQFVSSLGDVAFAIVRQVPSYSYILAQGTFRLNTGRWYYLVGTWDSSKVKLYINGALNREITNTLGAAAFTNGPIVVGSQLMEGSTMQEWYGFNGKINGVKVSSGAKSAAQITADYNTGLPLTSGW